MNWNRKKTGRMRWGVSWAAAYALVFQVILTSTLIASMPRGVSAAETCFGSMMDLGGPSSANGAQTDSGGPEPAVHCPACLARVDLLAVPPPLAVPVPFRHAVIAAYAAPMPAGAHIIALRHPGLARAPPHRT